MAIGYRERSIKLEDQGVTSANQTSIITSPEIIYIDSEFIGEGHIDDSNSRESTPSHLPFTTRSAEGSTLKPS